MPKREKKKFPLKTYLISAARRISRWNPAKAEALKLATDLNGKVTCAKCTKKFFEGQIQMDHINAVRADKELKPVADYENGIFKHWNEYYANLYCRADNYQALCRRCHVSKTLKERKKK